MKWLAIGGIVLCGLGTARAELKWQEREVELHPKASDATAVAHFHYENVGDKPVHIDSVQPSCGCTVATLKSHDVPPGAKGEIIATFNIGGRTGLQHKMITVTSDDPKSPRTVLTLTANVPKLVDVQPIFLIWQGNEPLDSKKITIATAEDAGIKNFEVTSSSPQITARIAPDKEPLHWTITVTPKAGHDPFAANIALKPEGGTKSAQATYNVGVRVLARPVSPAP